MRPTSARVLVAFDLVLSAQPQGFSDEQTLTVTRHDDAAKQRVSVCHGCLILQHMFSLPACEFRVVQDNQPPEASQQTVQPHGKTSAQLAVVCCVAPQRMRNCG